MSEDTPQSDGEPVANGDAIAASTASVSALRRARVAIIHCHARAGVMLSRSSLHWASAALASKGLGAANLLMVASPTL